MTRRQCPVCRKHVGLRADGTLRVHGRPNQRCEGWGRMPVPTAEDRRLAAALADAEATPWQGIRNHGRFPTEQESEER